MHHFSFSYMSHHTAAFFAAYFTFSICFYARSAGQLVKLPDEAAVHSLAGNMTVQHFNSSLLQALTQVTGTFPLSSTANASLLDVLRSAGSKSNITVMQILIQGPNISYHPMINFNYGGSYFNEDNSSMTLGYGPTYGTTNGVMFGPTIGDTFGPSYGASIGNTFGPMYGASIGPTFGSSFGPTIGATYGPSYGATYGETFGPSYGATYGGTYGPSYGATYGDTFGPSYGATYGPTYGPSYGATYGGTRGPSYGATYNVGNLPVSSVAAAMVKLKHLAPTLNQTLPLVTATLSGARS